MSRRRRNREERAFWGRVGLTTAAGLGALLAVMALPVPIDPSAVRMPAPVLSPPLPPTTPVDAPLPALRVLPARGAVLVEVEPPALAPAALARVPRRCGDALGSEEDWWPMRARCHSVPVIPD